MLARMAVTREGIAEFGFVPCYINKQGAPEVLDTYEKAKEVIDYVADICREEKLSVHLAWQPDGWVKVTESDARE